ncbi:DUF4870 domain-containing protein [Cryobacterium melibiosiphilum]|uniref:DUF4870 domain-containing protein n=1 Tax=Cryobacterium melibiosiphilum TaxID=995039 RepID=A0A3A5MNW4_9MICO|nr:DUF4870 domain-containing protein [Cryobacterium melibiosiphilum]RJT87204.1 DUF4870 domain-containing protein [Cryobacterium melibiosiphilum]
MSDSNAQNPNAQNPNAQNPNDPNLSGRPPQPPYQPQYPSAPAAAGLTPAKDIEWGSYAHLGGLLGFVPALIIWIVFKDRGRFTDAEGKEALNFQITVLIGYVAATVLTVVTFGLLSWLFTVIWILSAIFSVMGFLAAKEGRNYRYPFALRLIK